MLYTTLENNRVKCHVCSHECVIGEGKHGFCLTRENREGKLYTLNYNVVSSAVVDPIEKKPLYHFMPGSLSYSLGTVGCNFRCMHCQNYTISQMRLDEVHTIEISPEDAVNHAVFEGCRSIAFTYNEPTIWFEYTYDVARLAHDAGIATVYVTNGYITEEALRTIAPYLDAFRVDIKSFSEEFYKKICSARLEPVLNSAKLARELGMHVEVINLIIPTLNDSPEELRKLVKWTHDNLGEHTPLHFTRFYPYYKLDMLPTTPLNILETAYSIAKDEGMKYVYIGNVPDTEHENTYCPSCGELLIKRYGFEVIHIGITPEKTCSKCGEPIEIVL
jgi:pyruvate formate lyase activating enzyme